MSLFSRVSLLEMNELKALCKDASGFYSIEQKQREREEREREGDNVSVSYLTRTQTNGIFLYPLHAQRFKNQTSESACPVLTEKESQHELRLFCDFSAFAELFDGGTVTCVEISPIAIFFNCERVNIVGSSVVV